MIIQNDFSLLGHNTFGIDASTRHFVEYDSAEELMDFLSGNRQSLDAMPVMHIGCGSNLLFLSDYQGYILHSRISGIQVLYVGQDEVHVRVGAGVLWDDFVAYSVGQGWYGLENLSLIPGEVGAAAVQNIGAYGLEVKDFIEQVECVSLQTAQVATFRSDECRYAYRQSIFKNEFRGKYAVTYVTFRLMRKFEPRIAYGGIRSVMEARGCRVDDLTPQALREIIIGIRRSKLPDPNVLGNAGSFFMNPVVPRSEYDRLAAIYPDMPHYYVDDSHEKIPAGWLIEKSGWKGRSLGRAAVHDRQALILVNLGGATGAEILGLCNRVCADVLAQFGVALHPEVNMIGEAKEETI